jgi:hypothetical protein
MADLYASCLREHEGAASNCRAIARKYLECRMEAGLMAREELAALGLSKSLDAIPPQKTDSENAGGDADGETSRRPEERRGFVAGMRTAKRRTGTGEHTSERGKSNDA